MLVQGDTTTARNWPCGVYEQIPVGHVEAGLRTDNLLDPFPEEANRRLLADRDPALRADPEGKNLRVQGRGEVSVTGNTVIDAFC